MRKLTFDSIMDFCGKHNRSVFQKIVEAQWNGTLSSFVGAGLSVPFGYKQWGGVLTELANNIMDDDQKALVLEQIRDSKYEEAAGTIGANTNAAPPSPVSSGRNTSVTTCAPPIRTRTIGR